MARLPLHTLPAFRAVARRQNLREAADELHLTASAISQQIALLEEQIGFRLFDRRGRRVVLNSAGATLQRAVEAALDRLDDGLRGAAAAASGEAHTLRITLLPSFAQRWLMPRMPLWRERHPGLSVELDASQRVVDLSREGFHVALRQGRGPWKGLESERLVDSPFIVVGSPAAAERLRGAATPSLAQEPLLGDTELWERWFAMDGCTPAIRPVAVFNDAGLMLQATEQGIGIALARELYAADALRAGRLVRLSPIALPDDRADAFWMAYPPELRDWPPVVALRDWLHEQMAQSLQGLPAALAPPPAPPAPVKAVRGRAAARPTGSRSRARSG